MEKSESSTLEYKRQIPDDHIKFLKTVVAFANGRGGQIIFGIDDETHEVVGIESDNLFKTADSISNMIYDNCIPQIMCEVSLQTLQNKTVIVAQVYPGEHTPYFIKSLGLEQGCFVRVSATTRLADRETVKALMFEGSNIGFDRIIQRRKFVTEKEVRSFCKSLKNTALKNCETDEQKRSVKELTRNNLITWQLLYEKNGLLCPTYGYDLLSSNSLWCAKIQCAVFKGKDRSVFIDRREFAGSIQQQVEEAYNFVLRNIHLGAEIEGLYRRDIYEIPQSVIRELIINAVVHRNYLESSHIQIAIFDDRLEITSPGGLAKGVTIERIKRGFSKVRNEALANAFHYMHLIEQWGTGIPRIVNTLKEYGLDEPEFIDMEEAVRTNIYRRTDDKSTTILQHADDKPTTNQKADDKPTIKKDAKSLILAYFDTHEECTLKELSEMLGLKTTQTKHYLYDLVEAGKIIAKGANRNRTYILNKPTTILQYAADKLTKNQKTDDKPTIKKDAKSLILAYFDTHEECTLKELSDMLGLKTTQTKHYLHDLVEAGKIFAKGANKNRTYSLVTEENE